MDQDFLSWPTCLDLPSPAACLDLPSSAANSLYSRISRRRRLLVVSATKPLSPLFLLKSGVAASSRAAFEFMPNGHRGSRGSSPLHTSDSEDRAVLKMRKKLLRRRVCRRWRQFARRKVLRAAAQRIHYFFNLDDELCAHIAGFVVAPVQQSMAVV